MTDQPTFVVPWRCNRCGKRTETSGSDAGRGPGAANQTASQDAVASVEAEEGGLVLAFGAFPGMPPLLHAGNEL